MATRSITVPNTPSVVSWAVDGMVIVVRFDKEENVVEVTVQQQGGIVGSSEARKSQQARRQSNCSGKSGHRG